MKFNPKGIIYTLFLLIIFSSQSVQPFEHVIQLEKISIDNQGKNLSIFIPLIIPANFNIYRSLDGQKLFIDLPGISCNTRSWQLGKRLKGSLHSTLAIIGDGSGKGCRFTVKFYNQNKPLQYTASQLEEGLKLHLLPIPDFDGPVLLAGTFSSLKMPKTAAKLPEIQFWARQSLLDPDPIINSDLLTRHVHKSGGKLLSFLAVNGKMESIDLLRKGKHRNQPEIIFVNRRISFSPTELPRFDSWPLTTLSKTLEAITFFTANRYISFLDSTVKPEDAYMAGDFAGQRKKMALVQVWKSYGRKAYTGTRLPDIETNIGLLETVSYSQKGKITSISPSLIALSASDFVLSSPPEISLPNLLAAHQLLKQPPEQFVAQTELPPLKLKVSLQSDHQVLNLGAGSITRAEFFRDSRIKFLAGTFMETIKSEAKLGLFTKKREKIAFRLADRIFKLEKRSKLPFLPDLEPGLAAGLTLKVIKTSSSGQPQLIAQVKKDIPFMYRNKKRLEPIKLSFTPSRSNMVISSERKISLPLLSSLADKVVAAPAPAASLPTVEKESPVPETKTLWASGMTVTGADHYSSARQNQLKDLGFRKTEENSLVILKFRNSPSFKARCLPDQRLLIIFSNTTVKKRNLLLPLDTSFFYSPIVKISPGLKPSKRVMRGGKKRKDLYLHLRLRDKCGFSFEVKEVKLVIKIGNTDV